ncbi:recombinase family protein [Candidatus Sulfurimonas marisnigri]|uniref:Recombinase family protein n=1 Tax=Candidatus Sulfurimonas marisnigri TaxID=2740405 RepID=A0A7S7RQG6_9BACT|nr:recombinase family protein [Candidatus Sulfurimonas marisnigri]QOY55407.1 recombinase family protein [Candidatus Sulfurimonas marisnigri]
MIIGYTRVSTDKQTTDTQKHTILEYTYNNKIKIDDIIEVTTSTRNNRKDRQIDTTLEKLQKNDTLIVYALDRLGRSTIETLQIIEDIKNKGIKLIIIKENLVIDSNNTNAMNTMMLTMLTAVAELERSFISERTKQGLARVKANGTKLGRQKGQQVKSIFDEHKDKITELINLGVTNKRIHEYINIGSVQSLGKYIKTRNLKVV